MIQKIEPEPQAAPAVSAAPTKPDIDDQRYFKLSKPITVADKKITRLLVDCSELTGTTYFNLVGRFRRECPDVYRSSFNKLGEETFLSYVVAELNPPMVVEDVQKITFKDLPILFLQLASFLFADRTSEPTPPTTTR